MTKPQSFLGGLGINTDPAGTPFWKPTGREQIVTVLTARAPAADEAVKKLPDSADTITVRAIFAVQVQGVEHTWEVGSARCIEALDKAITSLPCRLAVKTQGEGKKTTFVIRPAKDSEADTPARSAPQSKSGEPAIGAPPCPAPRCALYAEHSGQHKTELELKRETASTRATELVPHETPA